MDILKGIAEILKLMKEYLIESNILLVKNVILQIFVTKTT